MKLYIKKKKKILLYMYISYIKSNHQITMKLFIKKKNSTVHVHFIHKIKSSNNYEVIY